MIDLEGSGRTRADDPIAWHAMHQVCQALHARPTSRSHAADRSRCSVRNIACSMKMRAHAGPSAGRAYERGAALGRDDWIEGPHARRITVDGELRRTVPPTRRARWDKNLFAPADEPPAPGVVVITAGDRSSLGEPGRSRGPRIVGSALESAGLAAAPSARWRIRQLGIRSHALGGPHRLLGTPPSAFAARITRAASRAAPSTVRPPAPTFGCSRRSRKRLRRNSSADFRHGNVGAGARPVRPALDPSAPEPDSSSRELIRGVRKPICRLRRPLRRLRLGIR